MIQTDFSISQRFLQVKYMLQIQINYFKDAKNSFKVSTLGNTSYMYVYFSQNCRFAPFCHINLFT